MTTHEFSSEEARNRGEATPMDATTGYENLDNLNSNTTQQDDQHQRLFDGFKQRLDSMLGDSTKEMYEIADQLKELKNQNLSGEDAIARKIIVREEEDKLQEKLIELRDKNIISEDMVDQIINRTAGNESESSAPQTYDEFLEVSNKKDNEKNYAEYVGTPLTSSEDAEEPFSITPEDTDSPKDESEQRLVTGSFVEYTKQNGLEQNQENYDEWNKNRVDFPEVSKMVLDSAYEDYLEKTGRNNTVNNGRQFILDYFGAQQRFEQPGSIPMSDLMSKQQLDLKAEKINDKQNGNGFQQIAAKHEISKDYGEALKLAKEDGHDINRESSFKRFKNLIKGRLLSTEEHEAPAYSSQSDNEETSSFSKVKEDSTKKHEVWTSAAYLNKKEEDKKKNLRFAGIGLAALVLAGSVYGVAKSIDENPSNKMVGQISADYDGSAAAVHSGYSESTKAAYGESSAQIDPSAGYTVRSNTEAITTSPEFSPESMILEYGEGLRETIMEMNYDPSINIPVEKWTDVVNAAGPQLKELYPNLVYQLPPNMGNWGWNMTPDRQIPADALELILNTARTI